MIGGFDPNGSGCAGIRNGNGVRVPTKTPTTSHHGGLRARGDCQEVRHHRSEPRVLRSIAILASLSIFERVEASSPFTCRSMGSSSIVASSDSVRPSQAGRARGRIHRRSASVFRCEIACVNRWEGDLSEQGVPFLGLDQDPGLSRLSAVSCPRTPMLADPASAAATPPEKWL